jgi:hypothetical protein
MKKITCRAAARPALSAAARPRSAAQAMNRLLGVGGGAGGAAVVDHADLHIVAVLQRATTRVCASVVGLISRVIPESSLINPAAEIKNAVLVCL